MAADVAPDVTSDIEEELRASIARLALLPLFTKNMLAYYEALRDEPDLYLKIAAWCGVLKLGAVRKADWDEVVRMSQHGAVAIRAFDYFMACYEYDYARRVAAAATGYDKWFAGEKMRAMYAGDHRALLAIEAEEFRAQGRVESLYAAWEHAERAGGWKESARWALRSIQALPTNEHVVFTLLGILDRANRPDLLRAVREHITAAGMFSSTATIYAASELMEQRNAGEALAALRGLDFKRLPPHFAALACLISAKAYEALGDFTVALEWYQRRKDALRSSTVDAADFQRTVDRFNATPIERLPDDTRENWLLMTGFPRSGTTLLEMALEAHPLVETFEELPSRAAAFTFLDNAVGPRASQPVPTPQALEARRRYYEIMDRVRLKPGASIFIDKQPDASAAAPFLKALFPAKRYIFSIRHPYDVIFSCITNVFSPNVATANFDTFAGACALYDYAMTNWFSVHTLGSDQVCYVRYELLVADFTNEMKRVLAFLGLEWNDRVSDFGSLADDRRASTPSYRKVRQGLTLGVQSNWRKYRSLFEQEDARVLNRWVRHFGYQTVDDI